MKRTVLKSQLTPEEERACKAVLRDLNAHPRDLIKALWQLATVAAREDCRKLGAEMGVVCVDEVPGKVFLVIDGERTDVAEYELIN